MRISDWSSDVCSSDLQTYMLTAFMPSQDPARFATLDLDDPSTWEVARSLPTFKDQTNKILANHTNLGAHFGSGRVRHDLSTGVEFSREQLDSIDIDALDGTAWPAATLYDPDPRVTGLAGGRPAPTSRSRPHTIAAYDCHATTYGGTRQHQHRHTLGVGPGTARPEHRRGVQPRATGQHRHRRAGRHGVAGGQPVRP